MRKNYFISSSEELLKTYKISRDKLQKKQCIIVSELPNPTVKNYLLNFTNCCYNRMIDIFDDTLFLLDNNRIQAACTISRAMIETFAFLTFTVNKVKNEIEQNNLNRENLIKIILKSINSSRFKVKEQEKVEKNQLDMSNYTFTQQAIHRMTYKEAYTINVMTPLDKFFKQEIQNGKVSDLSDEAFMEQVYNLLSEWVHPSQISLFTHYVEETHKIATSLGIIDIMDHAKWLSIQALSLIKLLDEEYNKIEKLADTLPE